MLESPVFQAALLGILQGLTEFLPISSSGHLLLLPWLLGWTPMGLAFDVMLHLGTLMAVLAFFREDWRRILSSLPGLGKSADAGASPSLGILIAATAPAAVIGVLFKGVVESHLRGPETVLANLAVFALALWLSDRIGGKRKLEEIGYKEALLVGLAQSLALMPGVSRSGITISAALLLGFKRWDAARFSFLMAAPLIALAGAYQTLQLLAGSQGGGLAAGPLVAGVALSFISGWLCIKLFLRFVQSNGLTPFVVYRLLLAGLGLTLLLRGAL